MELNLFRLSLIIALLGIFSLLLLSFFIDPKLTKINSINEDLINQKVKVQGDIISIKNYKESNFQVISLGDKTGKIDITASPMINLTNNQTIIVIGKINEYEDYLQIQADKIWINS